MNIFSKIYCRIFQQAFHIAIPLLPYRSPKLIELTDLNTILKDKKLLIVTDKNLIKNGLINNVTDNLNIPYVIFDDTMPNPTVSDIEYCLDIYKKNQCNALLALGGGSAMDLAKIVGARAVKPKKSVNKMRGLLKICKKLPPLIAIPTTAGTGSETTLAAVITDDKTHHKYPINDFSIIPHYAILDPSFTTSLPKGLTSTTGMDALTHAVEAFIGHSTTKKTRHMAIEATKLIVANIKTAYNEPNNLEARKNMLKAAHYAGIAFTISYVGYVHSIAHSLGGQYKIPHGLANAIILPIMLEKYGKKAYKRLAILAKESGIADINDSKEIAAKKFIDWIYKTNEELNIPKYIKEIKDEDINSMATFASKEGNPLYPVPLLMNKRELAKMYYVIRGDQNE